MDIATFLQDSKKRDLSDPSGSAEHKKVKEGGLEENPEADNVFTNSMESQECLQI